jgi:glutaconate CoA-transferase subunit B
MPGYSVNELFAVLLARDFRPEDRVIQVGANMPMARAAAIMAAMTSHPNTRVLLGLAIENLAGAKDSPPVLPFLFDPEGLDYGEAYMHQHSVFDNMSRPDVFFFSGLQVDRRGNLNLLGIRDGKGGWRLRGPGAVGLPTMSAYCSGYYVVMPRHDERTFVEQVDCVTALGDRRHREEYGLPGGGPRLILSPLGVFDLDDEGDMRVVSLHEGVSVDQVTQATGFELVVPGGVPQTAPPTDEELELLRSQVDVEGRLRDGA